MNSTLKYSINLVHHKTSELSKFAYDPKGMKAPHVKLLSFSFLLNFLINDRSHKLYLISSSKTTATFPHLPLAISS